MDGQYRYSEAEDGEEGFKKAKKDIPDLIISDVMMPKMDGFEFCAKIKTDERTSHIPVILITARAEQEDKIEGLETGADDYITKPFDHNELLIRVKNLIDQRRKLRERYLKDATLEPSEIAETSIDKQFLNRALEIIKKEISNPEFDVETFVKSMAVSRTHLYNKLRALAGQSAKEFIRTIRLKRGALLIKKQAGTISEIAYDVGFLNPSYFAECFRKQFGQSPSQYASQLKD
jgi:DNA-binding response OmpR family regulator